MDKWRQMVLKTAIICASLSFPVGILYFNSLESPELIKFKFESLERNVLQLAISESEAEIKELDLKILEIRGEYLKFLEKRRSYVRELEEIKEKIEKVIRENLSKENSNPYEKSERNEEIKLKEISN